MTDVIERVRGGSVVVQTNIHSSDTSLLMDAVRKALRLFSRVEQMFPSRVWQNWQREKKRARALCRMIGRIATKPSMNTTEKQEELKIPYAQRIDQVSRIALKAAVFKDNLDLDTASLDNGLLVIEFLQNFVRAFWCFACRKGGGSHQKPRREKAAWHFVWPGEDIQGLDQRNTPWLPQMAWLFAATKMNSGISANSPAVIRRNQHILAASLFE